MGEGEGLLFSGTEGEERVGVRGEWREEEEEKE